MELSSFERAVLEYMIAGDPEEEILRGQLCDAVVSERDYTGVGLYVSLSVPENAPRLKMTNRLLESTPMAFLKHPDLNPGGQAMLWVKNALMSCLEMVTMEGDWPKDESLFQIKEYGFPDQRREGFQPDGNGS